MDNYFESFRLHISQWTRLGHLFIYFDNMIQLMREKTQLIPAALASYLLFCYYGYKLFLNTLVTGYFAAVGSFLIFTLLYFVLWITAANHYFRCYKIKYVACIRDSLFQILFSQAVSLCFLVFGEVTSCVAFIVSYLSFFIIYDKLFVKRKLPDMKIAVDLEADYLLDASRIEDIKQHELKKTQISGEIRNCLVLKKRQPLKIKVSENEILRLGIGVKEFSYTKTYLRINGYYSDGESTELFNKEFKPRLYFRDRVWNDVSVELPKSQAGKAPETIEFLLDGESDANCYISFPMAEAPAVKTNKTNIYIIVVDSLRNDYFDSPEQILGKGYKHLAQLLKDSVIYSNAYTQGSWTLPTLASFLSGLYTSYHDHHHPRLQKRMNEDIMLLPEMLRAAGYDTYGYGTGPRLSPNYGNSRGFDRYYYDICDKEHGIATVDKVFRWALEQDRKSGYRKGQFFYLHLLEAHWPYYPPRDFEWKHNRISKKEVFRDVKKYRKIKGALDFERDQIEFFTDLYKAELDYCMHGIDRFIAYLRDRETYDDSFIVIMGDHGNNFGEHRSIGTVDLYQEYVKVGLTAKFPKVLDKKGAEARPTEANIDIAPTINDLLKLKSQFFNGKSLLETQGAAKTDRVAISEDLYVNTYSVAIRSDRNTFIYRTHFNGNTFKNFSRNDEVFELYDLKKDPKETENIFGNRSDSSTKEYFIDILNKHIEGALNYHGLKKDFHIRG